MKADYQQLLSFVSTIFESFGCPEEDAALAAHVLVSADYSQIELRVFEEIVVFQNAHDLQGVALAVVLVAFDFVDQVGEHRAKRDNRIDPALLEQTRELSRCSESGIRGSR